MKAMPVSGGRYFNNSIIASNPPADEPMATTGKWLREAGIGLDMADFDLLFFIVIQAILLFSN
jgi:hypothetical protein